MTDPSEYTRDASRSARSEPLVGELEAKEVLGGGDEAGDVEQRVVCDSITEQRARHGHRSLRGR